MAMIAGMAYRAKSLPIESVPSDTVLFCIEFATYSLPFLIYRLLLQMRLVYTKCAVATTISPS